MREGGYFRTRAGIKREIEMKSEARASRNVDGQGDSNALCQYTTKRAQGSSCEVNRITGE